MYTAASPDLEPDPNPRGGGQLPNRNECNSTLTSAARGETLTPNPNEWNKWGTAPTFIYKLREGVNYLTLISAILRQ